PDTALAVPFKPLKNQRLGCSIQRQKSTYLIVPFREVILWDNLLSQVAVLVKCLVKCLDNRLVIK
ncbi:hypothetical protein, partial [Coleofasciculus sp. FACHB-1120]|uniref:hypothetical protein n=1 Tax=Coleofasciculus sp. FACHB-1120 TaxID=2692783 RepID=UPI001A7EA11B